MAVCMDLLMNRSVSNVLTVVTKLHMVIHNVITTSGILLGCSSWKVVFVVWLHMSSFCMLLIACQISDGQLFGVYMQASSSMIISHRIMTYIVIKYSTRFDVGADIFRVLDVMAMYLSVVMQEK